ncbi:hypothetical protein ACFZA2_07555 [Microbacterium sp. NPDC007973]|uniref:hypothetical protein n=1 Tax=Microbacterium sp. NPDC007973 TaxID=3364182 RepID=UPI0036F1494E
MATGFSAEERAAMKQRAEELQSMKGLKGLAKLQKENEACLEAIEKLEGVDRAVAERLHVIVLGEAAHLTPKTYYGFPAYAKDGKVVVFYQPASKFKTRYGTVSFDDSAQLDDGPMWPVSFAVVEVTAEVEQRIREAVRRAAPAS